MEFTVRRDQTGPVAQRERRQEAGHQLVGVVAERDVPVGVVQQLPVARAHLVGHPERPLPFVVHMLGGVEPGLLLSLEGDIRPGLVRMPGQQHAIRHAKARVVACQSDGSALIAQDDTLAAVSIAACRRGVRSHPCLRGSAVRCGARVGNRTSPLANNIPNVRLNSLVTLDRRQATVAAGLGFRGCAV